MRRWVIIILLLIYPFQVSLAMADGCCVATPRGITHHSSGGQGTDAVPVFLADDAVSTQADPHCAACVLGQISGFPPHVTALPAALASGGASADASCVLFSIPASRPERPKWPARAR